MGAAITAGASGGLIIVGAVAAVWFLLQIGDVLKLLAVALILAVAVEPAVRRLERRRVPRMAAIVLLLLALVLVATGLGMLLIPPVVNQVADFAGRVPEYWQQIQDTAVSWLRAMPALSERLSKLDLVGVMSGYSSGALATAGNVATYVGELMTTLVMVALASLFMLVNPRPLLRGILRAVPAAHRDLVADLAGQAAAKLRAWVNGMLILSAVIGVVVGVALSIIGVPFAILFGLIAAVLEVVPTLGPILAAIPPTIVAFTINPWLGLGVIAVFLIVQQAESLFLAPLVMSKQLEMHPLAALVALLVMTSLLGVFGAVIALPLVAVLYVLYERLYLPLVEKGEPAQAEAVVAAEPAPKRRRS